MKQLTRSAVLLTALASSAVSASSNPAEAIAMVDAGAAYLQQHGKAALIKEINAKNPKFMQGELYLVVRGMDGVILAHPVNPRLLGKNMLELGDADGKKFRKEILEVAKNQGKGWVDYRYNNPTKGEIERKSTYLLRSGDIILEAGIYKGQ